MVSYSAFSVVVFGLVLATLISAETYSHPQPPPYQLGAGPHKLSSGSYVPPAGPYLKSQAYPVGDSYEYQNGGYKQPYGPSPTYAKSPYNRISVNAEVDEFDRLFVFIDKLIVLVDFAAETLANEDAQQSVLKKQVTQLTLLDLPALEEQNFLEDKQLEELEKKLYDLEDLVADLKANVEDLEYLNAENAKNIKEVQIALATEQYIDSTQVRDIASLLAAVQNLKTKLIIIAKNKFTLLDNEIQKVVGLFNSTRDLETSRMCETGITTLTADDRRNTVLFNTDFGGQVPQIEYGIASIKSKFVGKEFSKYPKYGVPYDPQYPQHGKPYDPQYPQYGKTYDSKYPQYGSSPYSDRDPGTLGDLVVALARPDAITFELVDAAFNNAETVSVDVAWEVCSIGPGTRLAKY